MESVERMEPSTRAGAPAFSFAYTPSEREHFHALWANARHGRGGRWVAGILAAVGVIPVALGVLSGDSPGDPLRYLLVYVVLATVAMVAAAWWAVRRALRSNPTLMRPHQIEIGMDGYRLRGPSMDIRRAWEGIVRVVETRRFFLLFQGPNQAFFLPKNLVPEERLDELRAFVEERLRAAAEPRPASEAPPRDEGARDEASRPEDVVLQATYTLDAPELVRATRDISRGTAGSWAWPAFLLLMPVLLVWLGMRSGDTLGRAVLENAFWVILLPAYLLVIGPYLIRREARALLRGGRGFAGAQTVEITGEGVLASGAAGESRIPWEGIVKARETDEFLLLYLSRSQALFIPLRAVAEGDLPAVRALIRARLPGRVRVREAPSTYPRKHRR
jgi:hypothetical protein